MKSKSKSKSKLKLDYEEVGINDFEGPMDFGIQNDRRKTAVVEPGKEEIAIGSCVCYFRILFSSLSLVISRGL